MTLSGNFTLSRNRLVRYRVIDDSGTLVTLDGNPIAGFPDVLGNLRVYVPGRPLYRVASVKYVGSFYTDNFKNCAEPE